jgi:8-oxo-dGTP pyrophosphatase MutT (NUDIX family)
MNEEIDFYQISLKLILKNTNGEILGLKAQSNSISTGFYDLPGGRINTNEFETNFSEILKREVREELGDIKFEFSEKPIAISRNLNKRTGNHILHIFFEGEYLDGEIRISDEHLEYKWINLEKINLSEYFTLGILDGMQTYIQNNTKKGEVFSSID